MVLGAHQRASYGFESGMLDEAAAGLRRLQKQPLAGLLRSLRDEGITILLLECSVDVVMILVGHKVVKDFGSKLTGGVPDALRARTRVRDAYLDWPI